MHSSPVWKANQNIIYPRALPAVRQTDKIVYEYYFGFCGELNLYAKFIDSEQFTDKTLTLYIQIK